MADEEQDGNEDESTAKKSSGQLSLWKQLADVLENPWDWTFAIGGGAVGCVGTIASHFADLGHSIPTCALGAVFARRAALASRKAQLLTVQADKLLQMLKADNSQPDLVAELQDLILKRAMKIDRDDKRFEAKIIAISDEDTKRKKLAAKKIPQALAPPNP